MKKTTRFQFRSVFQKVDKVLLVLVGLLVFFGLIFFLSASLSFLARNPAQFYRVLISHIGLGLIGGGAIMYALLYLDYTVFKKYALPFFITAIVLTFLVQVPFLSFEHGGARRWLSLGPLSFQPAEILKVAYVMYLAAWFSWVKDKVQEIRWGLAPFLIITAIPVLALFIQPDNGTILIMGAAGVALYYLAGMRMRDALILLVIATIGFLIVIQLRPYVMSRIQTFFAPSENVLSEAWQSEQARIALGSGQLLGRGWGKSVQKFRYLPEPAGDSIYAVIGEEFGFVGSVFVLILYTLFLLRAAVVAFRLPNAFARLLMFGLVLLIVGQSFFNMAAMMGIVPLSGMPLIFISQGGTALFFALVSTGIILNLSRLQKKHI
ncbi:MAG: FtsW/RodA/SpoVE family cell cycle protein [Candidatus Pacebacteria bacterium]|nr:FtsW/RodA/SpoVE family cell cycle protein [Candidatus Paceibacterota bacterium]MCD8528151.1 FtsW/RodA/SpoVE family cell cycle protein [Candidatus Paceibacterota bacterium]MCD8563653.1 FtsW/RodA/SpoVE family cell cycle protein [Candidatus Paceibacterota bacterium]